MSILITCMRIYSVSADLIMVYIGRSYYILYAPFGAIGMIRVKCACWFVTPLNDLPALLPKECFANNSYQYKS